MFILLSALERRTRTCDAPPCLARICYRFLNDSKGHGQRLRDEWIDTADLERPPIPPFLKARSEVIHTRLKVEGHFRAPAGAQLFDVGRSSLIAMITPSMSVIIFAHFRLLFDVGCGSSELQDDTGERLQQAVVQIAL